MNWYVKYKDTGTISGPWTQDKALAIRDDYNDDVSKNGALCFSGESLTLDHEVVHPRIESPDMNPLSNLIRAGIHLASEQNKNEMCSPGNRVEDSPPWGLIWTIFGYIHNLSSDVHYEGLDERVELCIRRAEQLIADAKTDQEVNK